MSDTERDVLRNADPQRAPTLNVDLTPVVLIVNDGDRTAEPNPEAIRSVSICSQNVTDD